MVHYLAVMLVHTQFKDHLKDVQAGDALGGPAISVFEHAEHLLVHQLDLGSEHIVQGRMLVEPSRLTKSASAFPTHFASGAYDAVLPEILRVYAGVIEWSGDFPTTRRVFQPPFGQEALVNALGALGYLDIADTGITWTDQAGAAMLDAAAWDPEFRSLGDQRRPIG